MKQFNALFGTIAGAALALACVGSHAGINDKDDNAQSVQGGAVIIMADNSSGMRDEDASPAMGGEGDDALGGNAPNPDPDRSVSTVANDAAITAAVKTKLLADTTVSGLKIDVDTRSGVVYLTGDNMNTQTEINQAIRIAKETDDVKQVVSELAVGDVKN